jgi:hypothetical protein
MIIILDVMRDYINIDFLSLEPIQFNASGGRERKYG